MSDQDKPIDQMETYTGDKNEVTLSKKDYNRLISQLKRYRESNEKLSRDLSVLKRKQNSKPEVKANLSVTTDKQIAFTATRVVRNDVGDVGYDTKFRKLNEQLGPLLAVIKPFINVAQAAVLSQDVFKRPPLLEKDESGNLTKDQSVLNGEKQWLPSRLDKAIASMNTLMLIPEFGFLANQLKKSFEDGSYEKNVDKEINKILQDTKPYEKPSIE